MSNNFKYSLQDAIGQGIFSTTYPAVEVNSQSPVVIKSLSENLSQQEDHRALGQRFTELAKRLSRCHHPHLPKVWESFTEDDLPYIVYDRIIGPTLADYVDTYGPIPQNLAFHWISQVTSAVQACHQCDVLHLDIHPHNIIYRQEWDDVVLVDVGLTTVLTPEIGQTHANLRPAGFAAPEQYDGFTRMSPATDVYALSATLYYFLTATAPPPAPLRSHIQTAEWFKLPEGSDAALETLIMQGLNLDARQRPKNPDVWLRELNALINEGSEVKDLEELEATVEMSTMVELPNLVPTPEPTPSRPAKVTPISTTTATKTQGKPRKTTQKSLRNAVVPNKRKFPLGALVMTSVIAASAGAGFGLSLRLNRPAGPGSSFWHVEQSFPPRDS